MSKKVKNIFIVDDTKYKSDEVRDALIKLAPEAEILTFTCGNDFLFAACYARYEEIKARPEEFLFLIDMQMPMTDELSAKIELDGGLRVLEELERKGLQAPAFIVTSARLKEEPVKSAYSYYKGYVRYDSMAYMVLVLKKELAEYLPDLGDKLYDIEIAPGVKLKRPAK